jgi:hypothetical protein
MAHRAVERYTSFLIGEAGRACIVLEERFGKVLFSGEKNRTLTNLFRKVRVRGESIGAFSDGE